MKQTIQVAMALVGLLVGAGFASGQEVIQYFLAFGYIGIVGAVISGIIIFVVGTTIFQLGSYYLADDHSVVFNRVSSPIVSKYMDYATMFSLFAFGFVMVAGAGSNLNQQFGFAPWIGATIMTVLLVLSGFLDVDRITQVISVITPFLIVAVFVAFGITIMHMPDSLHAMNDIALQQSPADGVFNNWLLSAVNYGTLVNIMAVSMMLVIAGSQLNPRTAGVGGLLGGLIFAIMLVILNFILFFNMDKVAGKDMPLLAVFDSMHPVVGVIVSIIIYMMIYNTAVGMFYAMARRLTNKHPERFRMVYFIVVGIGFLLSFVGFADLISWVYPAIGYLGIILTIAIIVGWFNDRDNIKEETGRRERLAELAETALDPSEDELTAKERKEVERLASESHVEDSNLWHSVQEEVAANLDADEENEFSLEDAPSLDPDHDDYEGAPESDGDGIDWDAYKEVYETGSFPAVDPNSPNGVKGNDDTPGGSTAVK